MGERYPRTVEAAGSSPAPSIYFRSVYRYGVVVDGWAISSVGERSPHKGEVGGSNPPSPISNGSFLKKNNLLFIYYLVTCRSGGTW